MVRLPEPPPRSDREKFGDWIRKNMGSILESAYGKIVPVRHLKLLGAGSFGFTFRVGQTDRVVKATFDYSEAYVAASLYAGRVRNPHLPAVYHVFEALIEDPKAHGLPKTIESFYVITMEYLPYRIEHKYVAYSMNEVYESVVREGDYYALRELNRIAEDDVKTAVREFRAVVDDLCDAAVEVADFELEERADRDGWSDRQLRDAQRDARKALEAVYGAVRDGGEAIIRHAGVVWLDAHAGNIRMRSRNDYRTSVIADLGYISLRPELADEAVADKLTVRLQNIVRTVRIRI